VTADDIVLFHHDGDETMRLADELADAFTEHYDMVHPGDPFHSRQRFLGRLAGYTRAPRFEMVTARQDAALAGYTFGYGLPPHARWWNGLVTDVPERFTDERDGTRSFALNELLVRAPLRGRNLGRRLVDALLAERTEERAVLLAEPGNTAAQGRYRAWGWRKVGELQPFPDSPRFDSLVIDLR